MTRSKPPFAKWHLIFWKWNFIYVWPKYLGIQTIFNTFLNVIFLSLKKFEKLVPNLLLIHSYVYSLLSLMCLPIIYLSIYLKHWLRDSLFVPYFGWAFLSYIAKDKGGKKQVGVMPQTLSFDTKYDKKIYYWKKIMWWKRVYISVSIPKNSTPDLNWTYI